MSLDDLRDYTKRWIALCNMIAPVDTIEQHFKRAFVVRMGKFHLEHVEAGSLCPMANLQQLRQGILELRNP